MSAWIRAGAIAVLAWAAAGAAAQPVKTIELGQPITAKEGAPVDFYRFGGRSGTTVKAVLKSSGPAALIFYTPSGEEMLSVSGSGSVALEAILPLTNVFLLGVLRADPSKPYTLKTTADDPDVYQQNFARYVGFRREKPNEVASVQCWIEPGHKLRETYDDGEVHEMTLGRAGKAYHASSFQGKNISYHSDGAIVGTDLVTTYFYSDGKTETGKLPLDYQPPAEEKINFVSYRCK